MRIGEKIISSAIRYSQEGFPFRIYLSVTPFEVTELNMKYIIALLIRYVPRSVLQRLSGIGLFVFSLFMRGNRVSCTICGKSYNKFLPYGRIHPRSNALCPGCLSLERHRLIWIFLKTKTDFFSKPLSVLHIAPEPCFIPRFRSLHGAGYVTADLVSPLADVKMDIHHMPFQDQQFDVVLCSHILEHVSDDIQAMSEIKRVLRPGGWAIIQVPFYEPIPDKTFEDLQMTDRRERERVFGQSDHVRRYGRDFVSRIEHAGLTVQEERFAFDLSEEERQRNGLVPEIIYRAYRA